MLPRAIGDSALTIGHLTNMRGNQLTEGRLFNKKLDDLLLDSIAMQQGLSVCTMILLTICWKR